MLGSELWEEVFFSSLLQLTKNFVVEVWEHRKQKLYGSLSGGLQSRPLAGNLGPTTAGEFQGGSWGLVGDGSQDILGGEFQGVLHGGDCTDVGDMCVDMCSPVYCGGCVADGRRAMAAY